MDLQRARKVQWRTPPAPPSPPPQPEAAAAPADPSRIWLPELVGRFAGSLPPNEVACVLRLVSKAAAAHFRGPQHATVHLSQPVPHSEFGLRWAGPDALRCLTRRQRGDLALLTARSGSITNLQVLLARGDMEPSADISTAAAGAGRLDVCVWLRQHGCPWVWLTACTAAAAGGHQAVCEWLLIESDHPSREAVRVNMACGAADSGHVGLMDSLLRTNERSDVSHLLLSAAAGCDLPTLQRLHHTYLGSRGEELPGYATGGVVAAAAGSRTADWQAKVEWLQARGYPLTERACCKAAAMPDAVSRLQWLQLRGFPLEVRALRSAAGAGNAKAVQYLLGQLGVEAARVEVVYSMLGEAAVGGHLAVMEVLHTHGVASTADLNGFVIAAAANGHLPAVAWLVQTLGAATALNADVFRAAARSGCTELLAWLHEQGCPWDTETFEAAFREGSQQQLEWLVERGCPMLDDGVLYVQAATDGDLAMLRCLRRLGCPWRDDGSMVTRIVKNIGWGLGCVERAQPGLLWLLDEGCPVDWASAESAAGRLREARSRGRLTAWLQEQRQQRQ